MPNDQLSDSQAGEMGFLDHLEELRWRIVRALIAVVVGAVLALSFKSILFDSIIFGPVKPWFPTNKLLCSISDALCLSDSASIFQALRLPTQISIYLMTGLIAGFILAFPYVFYQVWGFISPGLKEQERKEARGMTLWVSILFFLGVLFGYYVISPVSIQFFIGFKVSEVVSNKFTLDSYVSTVTILTLATGLLFQLPVVVMILARLGLITAEMLKKYRKHTLVGVLVLSALITPPDVASQVLVTAPIMLLYEISISLARRIERKRAAKLKQQ